MEHKLILITEDGQQYWAPYDDEGPQDKAEASRLIVERAGTDQGDWRFV